MLSPGSSLQQQGVAWGHSIPSLQPHDKSPPAAPYTPGEPGACLPFQTTIPPALPSSSDPVTGPPCRPEGSLLWKFAIGHTPFPTSPKASCQMSPPWEAFPGSRDYFHAAPHQHPSMTTHLALLSYIALINAPNYCLLAFFCLLPCPPLESKVLVLQAGLSLSLLTVPRPPRTGPPGTWHSVILD